MRSPQKMFSERMEGTGQPLSVTGPGGPDTLWSVNSQCVCFSCRAAIRRMVLLGSVLLSACGSPIDRADDQQTSGSDSNTSVARFRASYLTSLTFVGFQDPTSLLHVRFENRSEGSELALSYEGWLAGPDEWKPFLSLRDTLPVPRAAWRVVPAGPVRLRVGEGAQIESLVLPLDSTQLRIDALDAISAWSSTTGQRETLRSAELLTGDRAEPGLLLQQRRARILGTPRPDTLSVSFVLTDTLGNGLIILHGRALPDVPASVWAWLDGERIEWSDALLVPLSSPDSAIFRWSLEMTDQEMAIEIESSTPTRSAVSTSGSRYRMVPVRATLVAGDARHSMAGIRIEDAGP